MHRGIVYTRDFRDEQHPFRRTVFKRSHDAQGRNSQSVRIYLASTAQPKFLTENNVLIPNIFNNNYHMNLKNVNNMFTNKKYSILKCSNQMADFCAVQ